MPRHGSKIRAKTIRLDNEGVIERQSDLTDVVTVNAAGTDTAVTGTEVITATEITLARGKVLAGDATGLAAELDLAGGGAQHVPYTDGTDVLVGSMGNHGADTSGSSTASITVGGSTDSGTASITVGGNADSSTASITVGGNADSSTASITVGGSTDSGTASITVGGNADSSTASITVGGSTDSGTASITVGGSTDSDTASITVGGNADSSTASITVGGSTDSGTASITIGGNADSGGAVATSSDGGVSIGDIYPFCAFGTWGVDVDNAGGGIVGQTAVPTTQASTLAKVYDQGLATYAALSASAAMGGGGVYTSNFQIYPDAEAENDACYFGGALPFAEVRFNFGGFATYGADSTVWEYWDGAAWTAIPTGTFYDNTDATVPTTGLRPFQQPGSLTFLPPQNWAAKEVDSVTAFWIRSRVTAGPNITAIPTLSDEHALVIGLSQWQPPQEGSLASVTFNDMAATLHTANDVKVVLYDSVTGESRAVTFGQDVRRERKTVSPTWALTTASRITPYVYAEDGTNEPANVVLELEFVRTVSSHTHTGGAHTHALTSATATDAGHTHGSSALTATDAGHTHNLTSATATDAGHTHGSSALTATDAGHTHGSSALTATDAGHTHNLTSATATDAGHTHGSSALTATDAGHTHNLTSATATDAGHTHALTSATATDAGHTHGSSALTATDAGHTHSTPELSHTIA